MRHTILGVGIATVLVTLASAPAAAQTAPRRSGEEMRALTDQHKGDFDYLLGDWAFTAESRQYGTFGGFWSAVRLATGQVLDEYRIVDDNGGTIYVSSTLRSYNAQLDQWELVSVDGGNGLQDKGTGRRVGDEVQIEQTFGSATEQPSVWKIRYYNIQPDRFSWTADRSLDGGKTWVQKHQTIEARRIGPARSLGPLAQPKRAADSTQSTAAQPSDPISGNWGPDDGTLLELKFDGKSAVTGMVIWRDGTSESRAPIQTGTFDPKTGVLKLEGDAKRPDNGVMAHYVIEGRVDAGTLAGRFSMADHSGEFSFTRK